MTIQLAGSASTQSRARRPLPPGAVSARTMSVVGEHEWVEITRRNGEVYKQRLLSWPGGQWGGIWGGAHESVLPPEIVGHARRVGFGTQGSYGSHAEHDLADALGEAVGDLFAVGDLACRFGLNGSDVCAMAVRVARHATGRSVIASSGYHGHSDSLAYQPALGGIPKELSDLHRRFEFGDVNGMRQAAIGAACIMVEVPAWDDEEGITTFLRECRAECDRQGIPFILDEIVTGFRVAFGGVAERYGVKPDMAIYGKSMSAVGGASALVGDDRLVNLLADEVFYSGTFFGTPGPCAVSAATIRWLKTNEDYVYGYLQEIGLNLKRGLSDIWGDGKVKAWTAGQAERFIVEFAAGETARREWCAQMIARGVMVDRPFFATLVHTAGDVEATLAAARLIEAGE